MEAHGQAMPPLVAGRIWREPNQITPPRRVPQFPSVQLAPSVEKYANEIVVTKGDTDAVMTFYIVRGETRTKVAEITVPLGAITTL